jgi:uncharacterized Zn-finger protein
MKYMNASSFFLNLHSLYINFKSMTSDFLKLLKKNKIICSSCAYILVKWENDISTYCSRLFRLDFVFKLYKKKYAYFYLNKIKMLILILSLFFIFYFILFYFILFFVSTFYNFFYLFKITFLSKSKENDDESFEHFKLYISLEKRRITDGKYCSISNHSSLWIM